MQKKIMKNWDDINLCQVDITKLQERLTNVVKRNDGD